MATARLKAGELTAVIGDNAGDGEHRPGYNGVWSLHHARCDRSLFVPAYAGLNLEHIFDGETEFRPGLFFEPRGAAMELSTIGDDEAELHQPETPATHVESWTRFRLVAPHYLDMTFRFRPHLDVFANGYVGLFWASYINAPEDKSMYFLGGADRGTPQWTQLCTQQHNDESTVRHVGDDRALKVASADRGTLYDSMSPLRFAEPFFYGRFENMVWIVMFDRAQGIRFSHSPSGGGGNAERRTTCPAWDFQFIVPDPRRGAEYGFTLRTAFRPASGRTEILEEVKGWSAVR